VPVQLYNVHPTSPGLGDDIADDWNEGWRAITGILDDESGSLVIAGDFNINQHHHWYRELKDMGLRSAHEQRGRGNATTWPTGRKLRPIRIDHIFQTRDIVPLSVREGRGEGSDHRPVIAELAVLDR
jgi:endonuclease/exonuclease/phosphatase (EEP) superfamily protein YafD